MVGSSWRKDFNSKVSSPSGEHGKELIGVKAGYGRAESGPPAIILGSVPHASGPPHTYTHREPLGVLRTDANFRSLCVGIPGRMLENQIAVATVFLTLT